VHDARSGGSIEAIQAGKITVFRWEIKLANVEQILAGKISAPAAVKELGSP
jgi:hypothetical protein